MIDFDVKVNMARELAGGPHLNDRRIPENVARAINEYLLYVASRLRVQDWMVVVNDDEPRDKDAVLSMNSRTGTKFAGVWVSDRFLDPFDPSMSDFMRTQSLIHEVLHLHFEEAWTLVDDVFEQEFTRAATDIGNTVFKRYMEVAVDQLAWALAEGMFGNNLFHLPDPE